MKDLRFEQKRSLSRREAADQLAALAAALRDGGEAELELGSATLSLRIPDDLRSEVEIEIGDGEVELEIEFKWPTTRKRPAQAPTAQTPARKSAPAKPARGGTGKGVRRPTAKK